MTDRRKLMQIGFAALLARKQTVQKQYLYEDRTDGGFVFEPILRNNEPMMANEEYMRKKYYSQVVYEGTMDGSIDTSIQEGDPNKRAARRLWAGRKGTGWAGTGKGGYMASLQPGVPETKGTGAGSPKKESDLLMQVYLEKQSQKMHILKGKSQQATKDLFNEVAKFANKKSGVVDLSYKEYVPSPKDQGASLKDYRMYVGPRWSFAAGEADNPEWAEKAVRKLASKDWKGDKTNSRFFTSYGFVQGKYAEELLKMHPEEFLKPSQRRRLLANNMYRQPAGGDRTFMGEEGMLKGAGGLYHDWDTVPTFGDYEDDRPDYDAGVTLTGPSKNEGSDFSGDGGALTFNNMEIADADLLRVQFKKESVSDLFPKSYQEYQRQRRLGMNEYFRQEGQLLNQDLDVPQVEVRNWSEAEKFVRWMQKELNDEQERLNKIIPQHDDWGYVDWKSKSDWVSPYFSTPFHQKYAGTSGKGGGGFSITHQFLAGPKAGGDYKSEIVRGFLGDFGLLNDEAKYKMSTRFGLHKDKEVGTAEWKWINESKEDRGVDLYLPQDGGLLRIHVSAKVVPGTKTSRPYVKLDIPYPSKWNNYRGGGHFIPDVNISLQDMEIMEMKGEENLNSFNTLTNQFWQQGAWSQYMGFTMQTHNGHATRMFLGDTSPANSVAFFTNTVSADDFADRLKDLVDIGAEYWWNERSGFEGYFNLEEMEGGAFKSWALKWEEESKNLKYLTQIMGSFFRKAT